MATTNRGTIKDFPGFKANDDAEALRKAMKGLGTDEDPIMKILTSRSNAQRQKIDLAFKTLFGRDLVVDLKSELAGKLEKVVVALMTPANMYDAQQLRLATKGAGTTENVLAEILASRSTPEIHHIKKVYKEVLTSCSSTVSLPPSSEPFRGLVSVLAASLGTTSLPGDAVNTEGGCSLDVRVRLPA